MDINMGCDGDCLQCGDKTTGYIRHPEQPETFDINPVDGVMAMPIVIPKAGTILPQHSHPYPHISLIGHGGVKVWADDVFLGEHHAPDGIRIAAGVKHRFETLADNTIIFCVHNISRRGRVEFNDDHHLVKEA